MVWTGNSTGVSSKDRSTAEAAKLWGRLQWKAATGFRKTSRDYAFEKTKTPVQLLGAVEWELRAALDVSHDVHGCFEDALAVFAFDQAAIVLVNTTLQIPRKLLHEGLCVGVLEVEREVSGVHDVCSTSAASAPHFHYSSISHFS